MQNAGVSLFILSWHLVLFSSSWLSIAMRMMPMLQPHLGVLPVPCPSCFSSLIHCSGKLRDLAKLGSFWSCLSKEAHGSFCQSVLHVSLPCPLPPLFPVKYSPWLAEQKWIFSNTEKFWGCSLFLSWWVTLLITPCRKLRREKNPLVEKTQTIK